MKDLVPAVAVGLVGDTPVVDLSYKEEQPEGIEAVDIPLAYIPSTDEITLLQMDGITNKDQIIKVIEMAREPMKKIAETMRAAILEKYKGDNNE